MGGQKAQVLQSMTGSRKEGTRPMTQAPRNRAQEPEHGVTCGREGTSTVHGHIGYSPHPPGQHYTHAQPLSPTIFFTKVWLFSDDANDVETTEQQGFSGAEPAEALLDWRPGR